MVSGTDPRRTKSEARVADPGDEEVCWICLDDAKQDLLRPCLCPRWVHARCMARWQLQCSGKAEEEKCKFCQAQLPNWRAALFKDVLETEDNAETNADGPDDGDSDGSVDADGAAMPTQMIDNLPRRIVSGNPDVGSSSLTETPPTAAASNPHRRRSTSVGHRRSSEDSAKEESLGDVKGDIIVKFNNMSFRCKVRTGHEGLEDFMEQIREKCGIPEHKMRCLNLTYRCKDPNTGSQMTLQGVNESAFDAAVLCSAAQDKIKQRRRASRDGGSRAGNYAASADESERLKQLMATPPTSNGKPPAYPKERDPSNGGESNGSGSSSGQSSDGGETSTASGKAKQPFSRKSERGDLDAGSKECPPGSPGKSGRFGFKNCDATSTRAERRRNSLDSPRTSLIAFGDGSVIARSEDENNVVAPVSSRSSFRRGARRLSAPPPSSNADPSDDAEQVAGLRRARRPWPSFMSALTRSKA